MADPGISPKLQPDFDVSVALLKTIKLENESLPFASQSL